MTKYLTYDEVLDVLSEAVKAEGSQFAFAKKHGFTNAYVSMVLRRKRQPGLPLLMALGIGREIHVKYARVDDGDDGRRTD